MCDVPHKMWVALKLRQAAVLFDNYLQRKSSYENKHRNTSKQWEWSIYPIFQSKSKIVFPLYFYIKKLQILIFSLGRLSRSISSFTHQIDIVFPFFFFVFLKAAPAAYRGSQARGQIAAAGASPCHSHSHMGSESHLQPIPQLTTTLDP